MDGSELQLVFRDDIQRLLDDFCALLDIRIAFFSTAGRELLSGRRKPICGFCGMLRKQLNRLDFCLRDDRMRLAQAERERRLVSYRCHAGLNEALLPVEVNGRLLGFVMIGQFRTSNRLSERLDREWRGKCGGKGLRRAFQAVPYLPPRKLKHVLGLFRSLVALIVTQRMVDLRGEGVLEPLLAHLKAQPGEPLRLAEAAQMVHRSPSTLAHLFKRKMGRSFTRVRTEARMEQAGLLLRQVPPLSVKEVAYRCGFEDPLYFSRVFRRRYGLPPSKWRETP